MSNNTSCCTVVCVAKFCCVYVMCAISKESKYSTDKVATVDSELVKVYY